MEMSIYYIYVVYKYVIIWFSLSSDKQDEICWVVL